MGASLKGDNFANFGVCYPIKAQEMKTSQWEVLYIKTYLSFSPTIDCQLFLCVCTKRTPAFVQTRDTRKL